MQSRIAIRFDSYRFSYGHLIAASVLVVRSSTSTRSSTASGKCYHHHNTAVTGYNANSSRWPFAWRTLFGPISCSVPFPLSAIILWVERRLQQIATPCPKWESCNEFPSNGKRCGTCCKKKVRIDSSVVLSSVLWIHKMWSTTRTATRITPNVDALTAL